MDRSNGGTARGLLASLRHYHASWLPGDAVAAFTLAAIAIPEQLATARLVGMPPASGVLAFAAGTVVFAAFGTHRFVSVGADSTIAPIMASALAALAAAGSAQYAAMAAVLALLTGAVLLAGALLRVGWIAELLSIPVTTGFLAGISIHIIVGQAPDLLGLSGVSGDMAHQVADIARQLPRMQAVPAAIGLGVLGVSLAAERISPRIPGALIGFIAAALIGREWGLAHHGVPVIGALPIPPLRLLLSASRSVPSWQQLMALLPTSGIIALVCMLQTAAVERSFPNHGQSSTRQGAGGEPQGVSRDLGAVGAGCLLSGLIGAFAVNASPPRTAAVRESGGKTQLAGLVAVTVVLGGMLLFADVLSTLPVAALSGVLVFIALRIFRLDTLREIHQRGGYEIGLAAASAALVVILPIQTGITISILLSLVHSIYIIARPGYAVLSRIPGTTVWWKEPRGEPAERVPGVLVFAPGAPVCFANATYIRRALRESLAAMGQPCRLLVIEANGVIDIDFTGAQMLQEEIRELHGRHTDVAFARLESERAQQAARRTGVLAALGGGRVFRTVEEAIRARLPLQE